MFIYRILLILLSPIIFLHVLFKAIQCRQWQYFSQRLGTGFTGIKQNQPWFHCASVGEVKALLPLLQELHTQLPATHFLITSNTATSREIIIQFNKNWIQHAYCPIDLRNTMRSFLLQTKPLQCNLIETELWPNMIELCHHHKIPIAIYNGRLSKKTTQSNRWMLAVYKHVLKYIDTIYARSEADRERYIKLGSGSQHTSTVGDLKLVTPNIDDITCQNLTQRDYMLAVSTHDPEEFEFMRACHGLLHEHLVVIAPRHPERGNTLAKQLRSINLRVAMHSKGDNITDNTQVYLLDTIGELDKWYGNATMVVMGGSFTNIGGHNILEPLNYHKAVVYGPHMHNFSELNDIVLSAQAAIQVTTYRQLQTQLQAWLDDAGKRQLVENNAKKMLSKFEHTIPAYADIFVSRLASTNKL